MPAVTVKYLVNLRDKAGTSKETINLPGSATLADVAEHIRTLHGISLPDPHIMATINGKGWAQCPEGLRTPVKDDDVVMLFPPLSGG